ncbi:MAG TPA: TonB-dependent receptor [Terriglobales bacterium]|nr:TonB-dependent receptor [Terriglobales bacterium]
MTTVFQTHLGGRSTVLALLLILFVGLGSNAQSASQTLSIAGVVTSGNTVIPGATVTATDSATGSKYVSWTGLNGRYSIQVPAAGQYTVRAEMTAFQPLTREVTAAPPGASVDFNLNLLSRTAPSEPRPGSPSQMSQRAAAAGNLIRGFQSLSVLQSEATDQASNAGQVVPSGMPVPGLSPDAATESVAVSGNESAANTFGMSTDEIQQRMREREMQGGPGGGPGGGNFALIGPGGSPGGGPGGGFGGGSRGGGGGAFILGGGRGRFDINRPHGSLYYTLGDSALNASPYSLTGAPVVKPAFLQQRFGGSAGGPLNIPKIYHGGTKTFFFVNYNGFRGANPYDAFSTVPTLLERQGNFSQTTVSTGPGTTAPVQIFDPVTHLPFSNETIPNINSAAAGLLKYIPVPNLPGDFQNFHYITTAAQNSDDANIRLIRNFGGAGIGSRSFRGPRNNLSFGFHYHGAENALTNPFPSVGGNTTIRSYDVPVAYIRSIGKLTNIARFDFNRTSTNTLNLYAFSQDITGTLGIGGVSTDPFDWGLPGLSFSHFGGIQDINPVRQRNQTITLADNVVWVHGKHNLRWGGDFRRIQLNTQTSKNARGSFVFTGFNTALPGANGQTVPYTGYDFADFLLGLAQQTSLQSTEPGANSYHFRGNSWDLYAQEEWKLRANLTLNLGVRYEYISPFTELNNRIANLDISPDVTAAVIVLPGQTGPYHGQFPVMLVRPDRNNLAPRLGVAWKATPKTVVRAGYGINYNTGAYQTIAQQLAFQPPFATAMTNVQSVTGELTLQNGFPPPATGLITNSYAVDPNYRLGYVQIWNLDVQQEIQPTLLLNLDYTGTKGTRLDILEAPNRSANGTRIPDVQPFDWQTSQGDSTAAAGSVRLRKRLQHGISIGGLYTWSKSIDNASTIGGGATVVAQNAFDLAAERGLSSFDQRHKFSADYLWELPFGHDRRWLTNNSPWRAILGDWQWSGDWTIATGIPFTPRILGDFADVNRGTNGTLRPNIVPDQSVGISHPSVAQWFNTAAFAAPPPGTFGDARRNSIEGPPTRVFDMAFTKLFPIKEGKTLEVRVQTANIFNTPQFSAIDTTLNSPTYGRVISVGSMRTIQLTARFRF